MTIPRKKTAPDEDFSFDIKHQLRRTGLPFNRLALTGDSILAAPATEIIESLIAAPQKRG